MVVVEVRETKRWRWGRWNIYTGRCCARLSWREGRAHGKPGMEEGRGGIHGYTRVYMEEGRGGKTWALHGPRG